MHGFKKKPEESHENYITEKHDVNDILKLVIFILGISQKILKIFSSLLFKNKLHNINLIIQNNRVGNNLVPLN